MMSELNTWREAAANPNIHRRGWISLNKGRWFSSYLVGDIFMDPRIRFGVELVRQSDHLWPHEEPKGISRNNPAANKHQTNIPAVNSKHSHRKLPVRTRGL